jgi:hypothetical protein
MKKPIASMMRKAKNTGTTGGRSFAGTSFKPGNSPFQSWVRTSEEPRGIEIAKRFVSVFSSGQAKIWKSPGLEPSQCASIAAILVG